MSGEQEIRASSSNVKHVRFDVPPESSSAGGQAARPLGARVVEVEPPGPARCLPSVGGRLCAWLARANKLIDRTLLRMTHGEWLIPRSAGGRAKLAQVTAEKHFVTTAQSLGQDGATRADCARSARRMASALRQLDDARRAPPTGALRLDTARLCDGRDAKGLAQLLGHLDAALQALPAASSREREGSSLAHVRANFEQARRDVNDRLADVLVTEGREKTDATWQRFAKLAATPGEPTERCLQALADAVDTAIACNALFAESDLVTPANADGSFGLGAFEVVREGLQVLDPGLRETLLPMLRSETLSLLESLFVPEPGTGDSAPNLVSEAIKALPQRVGAELGRVCRAVDKLLAAAQPAAAELLRQLDDQATLIAQLDHHCDVCNIALPEPAARLAEQARGQLRRVLAEPRQLVAHANAAQLDHLQRLARRLGVDADSPELVRRADELDAAGSVGLREATTRLAQEFKRSPLDPAAVFVQLHAVAAAAGRCQATRESLGRLRGDALAEVLVGLGAEMTPAEAAAARAALGSSKARPFVDPELLRRAAPTAELRGAGATLCLMSDLLGALRGQLRRLSGDHPRPKVAAPESSRTPEQAFEKAFGFALPPEGGDSPARIGEFDRGMVADMKPLLESSLSGKELKTVEVDGVVMPDQFHRDGKRAAAHGGGVQFYLPDGSPLIDLSHGDEPLGPLEVDRRVRAGFDRLVEFYDGNEARARAIAAFAHQGVTASLFEALKQVAPERNPFALDGHVGIPYHAGEREDAHMRVGITFKRLDDGRPGFALDYELHGGRLDEFEDGMPTGRAVALDGDRSRIHVHLDVALEEPARVGAELSATREMTERSHLSLVGAPRFGIELVASDFQRMYPKPRTMADLRPMARHPDAVDGHETLEQTAQRNGANRRLREGMQGEFMAHAGVEADRDPARAGALPAMSQALFACWEFQLAPSPARLEEALEGLDAVPLAALPKALTETPPPQGLRDQLHVEQQALRAAFKASGLWAALESAEAAAQEQVEQRFVAFRHGLEPGADGDPHAPAPSPAEHEQSLAHARALFEAELGRKDSGLVNFLKLMREFRARPTIAGARQLMREQPGRAPDVETTQVRAVLDACNQPTLGPEVLAGIDEPLAQAVGGVLPMMVAAVAREQSFSLA